MRKLMGIAACVGCALLLSSCGEQTKSAKDAVKDATARTKSELEKTGRSVQEAGGGASKAIQEAGTGASKALEEAGAGASKTVQETATKAAEETKTKISEAASKASEALGERFTKATEQASESVKNIKGGPELVQKLSAVIPSLQQTLAGITDKESAQKALPKLEELQGTVSKLSGQFDGLPEKAKQTVGDLVQKGMSGLQPLVDSVLTLPAVQSIRPKLEAIMNQLKSLKG
jgi:hypothetical protein